MNAVATNPMLTAALEYASRGWPVVPLHSPRGEGCDCGKKDCASPAKHPRTRNGLKDATTDTAKIAQWWSLWPHANIGIRTGEIAPGRFLSVLDVDSYKQGDETLTTLQHDHGTLPETLLCLTGGGGKHFYFESERPLRNTAGHLGAGLDTRGGGGVLGSGYVVAPPSVHRSGRTYEWELSAPETPAPLPAWLVALVNGPLASKSTSATSTPNLHERIVDGAAGGEGRKKRLHSEGRALRTRGYSEAEIFAALSALNAARCEPPLDEKDIQRVAEHAARVPPGRSPEYQRPRVVPFNNANNNANNNTTTNAATPIDLDALTDACTTDPSAVFEPSALQSLAALKVVDLRRFVALREQLKQAGVSLRMLDRAVSTAGSPPDGPRNGSTTGGNGNGGGGSDEPADWRDLLSQKKGAYEATSANVVTALTHAPEWIGVLSWNEFTLTVETRTPPPWHPDDAPAGGTTAGPWTDRDDTRLVCWLSRQLQITVPGAIAADAVQLVAQRSPYHPVREYLQSLEWDGVHRVPTWLQRYCGSVKQSESYLSKVGLWFLISAVARVLQPGCKVDYLIVLEGNQGAGKSTAAQTLMPVRAWFTEHTGEPGEKDSYEILKGHWLIEFAELDSLTRHEVAKVKKYVTTAIDNYRPVWARRVQSVPRQSVFFGTVNDKEYLRDATGDRRYWPVSIGTMDTAALEADRDQLWAEAVTYYFEGRAWWPSEDDRQQLTDEQEQRRRIDPWENKVADFVEQWESRPIGKSSQSTQLGFRREFLTSAEVLSDAIRKPTEQWTEGDQMRIGKIMHRLGWERRQVRMPKQPALPVPDGTTGSARRVWGYFPMNVTTDANMETDMPPE